MEEDDEAPGWHAIDRAVEPLYSDIEPKHFAPGLPAMFGGQDPLDGISAYPAGGVDDVPPHWHFVTYGMSELYAKKWEDPAVSGWGFEFTFRLVRGPDEAEPPMWALSFLQNLARYVCGTGNVFDVGHYMPLNGPIALGTDTKIEAALFAEDPQLPPIDSPHGRVAFLQVVGITLDELAASRAWSTHGIIDVMRGRDPLLLTDLDRPSILHDAVTAATVVERTRAEGSSTSTLFVSDLKVDAAPGGNSGTTTLTMGAKTIDDLRTLLAGRIPFGKGFLLVGPEGLLVGVEPGDRFAWTPAAGEEPAVLTLSADFAADLAGVLQPRRGSYRVPSAPGLVIDVVPSRIKDADGNVAYVIGE